MRFKHAATIVLGLAVASALFSGSSFAQSTPKQRPQLKDFGSSLKRLKWDPETKQAVSRTGDKQTQTTGDDDDVVRIESNLVSSDILVVDTKGNLVENLTADDFVVTEDGQPQKVAHFLLGDTASVPRTIVLIIDYSSSQAPFIRRSIDAAKLLIDKLAESDMMAIVTDDVELVTDFTNDKDKLKKILESLFERTKGGDNLRPWTSGAKFGKSSQYSALMATLSEAFIEEDQRPIIIFQTDGDEVYQMQDPILTSQIPPDLPKDLRDRMLKAQQAASQDRNMVEFSLADVYRMVEKSRATIYTVFPGSRLLNKSPEQQLEIMRKHTEMQFARLMSKWSRDEKEKFKAVQDQWRTFSPANLAFKAQQEHAMQQALNGVAPRTGGWTEFLETPEDAEGIYNRIMFDINHRYIVGYYPTNKAHDGTRRKIKFAVKDHPEYHVLGRLAYYAPTTP